MVLAGEYKPFHSGGDYCPRPLPGIKTGRSKNVRGFRPVAPFPVGEGVHGEMNECIKFQLLKSELSFRGYYAYQPSVKLHTIRLPK